MITFRLRLVVAPERRDEATAALLSLVGPVRAQPGCSATRMVKDMDDGNILAFRSEWREKADLERHLKTPAFHRILAIMELASEPPVVEIDELGRRWGFEFVEEALGEGTMAEAKSSKPDPPADR